MENFPLKAFFHFPLEQLTTWTLSMAYVIKLILDVAIFICLYLLKILYYWNLKDKIQISQFWFLRRLILLRNQNLVRQNFCLSLQKANIKRVGTYGPTTGILYKSFMFQLSVAGGIRPQGVRLSHVNIFPSDILWFSI